MQLNFTSIRKGLTLLALLFCMGTLQAQCPDAINLNPTVDDTDENNEPDGYYLDVDGMNGGSGTLTMVQPGAEEVAEVAVSGGNYGGMAQNISGDDVVVGAEYTVTADITVLSGSSTVVLEYFTTTFGYLGGEYSGATVTPADGPTTVTVTGSSSDAMFGVLKVRVNALGASVQVSNICVTVAGDPVGNVCDNNLLNNGGFEGDLSDYSDFSGNSSATADAFSGSQAIFLPGTPNDGFGQYGIAATVGNAYRLTAQAKAGNLTSGYGSIRLEFRDAGGASLGQANADILSTEYTAHAVSGVAPAGTVTVIMQAFSGDGRSVTIDDACLIDLGPGAIPAAATEPEGNLLPDFGFENDISWFDEGFGCFSNGCGDVMKTINDPATGEKSFMIAGQTALTFDVVSTPANRSAANDVVPGDMYTATVTAKLLGTTTFAQMKVDWKDASDNVIAGVTDNVAFIGGEEFSEYTFTTTAPADAAKATIFMQKGDGGSLIFDDWSFVNATLLPVTLNDFRGKALGKANKITWSTSSEENTEMFYLERSRTGVDGWAEIARVNAAGNSDRELVYEAMDEQPLGVSFYRLRSVDFDGATQLSDVIHVERASGATLLAYPNPIGEAFTVETEFAETTNYSLYDALGRELRSGRLAAGFQRTRIATQDLPAGRYLLRVAGETVVLLK